MFLTPSWCSKVLPFITSSLFRELPVASMSQEVFWWESILVFLHLRISGFPPHLWRKFSEGIWFWVNNSLLSILEECCAASFWPPFFLMYDLLSFKLFSSVGNVSFLSCILQDSFVFSIQKFDYVISQCRFPQCNYGGGVHSKSWIWFVCSARFWKFIAIIWVLLRFVLFLHFFSVSNDTNVISFVIPPQVTENYSFFILLYFFSVGQTW